MQPIRFSLLVLLATASAALLASTTAAQETTPAAAQPFSEVIEVNIVNVSVTVTDKEGNPVTGLGRDDFELYEDGKKVEIANFYAVAGGERQDRSVVVAPPPAPSAPDEGTRAERVSPRPPAEPVAVPEPEVRHFAIFIDNNHLQKRNRKQAFQGIRDFLFDNLDPRDEVMVASLHHEYQVEQGFTSSSADIVQTLDRLEKAPAEGNHIDNDERQFLRSLSDVDLAPPQSRGIDGTTISGGSRARVESASRSLMFTLEKQARDARQQGLLTIAALRYLMSSMSGIQGRKQILYVSDGLPMRPEAPLFHAFYNRFEHAAQAYDFDIPLDPPDVQASEYDLTREFAALAIHAQGSEIVFNAIDASGMRASFGASAEFGLRDSDSAAVANYQPVWNSELEMIKTQNEQGAVGMLAEQTGGIMLANTRDYATFFKDFRNSLDYYYSLGFRAPHGKEGGHHGIVVKVLRPDLVVRHQRAYRDKTWDQRLTDLTVSHVVLGTGSNDLDVQVVPLRPTPREGKLVLPLKILMPIGRIDLLPQGEELVGDVTIAIVIKEPNGSTQEPKTIPVRVRLPKEAGEDAATRTAEADINLLVDPGDHVIGIGLRDASTGLVSTTSLEVSLPSAAG